MTSDTGSGGCEGGPPRAAGSTQGESPAGTKGGGPFNHPAPPGAAKRMSEVLGEIVWLMSQSPLHKQFFISDLEWPVAASRQPPSAAQAARRQS